MWWQYKEDRAISLSFYLTSLYKLQLFIIYDKEILTDFYILIFVFILAFRIDSRISYFCWIFYYWQWIYWHLVYEYVYVYEYEKK